jgi:hypothetical protein
LSFAVSGSAVSGRASLKVLARISKVLTEDHAAYQQGEWLAKIDPAFIVGVILFLLATLYLVRALGGTVALLWGVAAVLYILSAIFLVAGSKSR